MTVTKTHNGICISDMIDGFRVERLYQGYTVAQTKKLFKLLYT